ncbi:hypothetical protein LRB11_13445 [Ectothiorhodospira haloalkaliphila]|uniref:hypothetical protein n=2 Tax=Ectothiorhodospira TaxID=1051 RepID=UPI001EE89818|nr:hypothetical protein [Ectothiorhodospira haloalkaliphila]MCG5525924.1 hypothetical protein [Ectothiorhodospira haloalkaliphila]
MSANAYTPSQVLRLWESDIGNLPLVIQDFVYDYGVPVSLDALKKVTEWTERWSEFDEFGHLWGNIKKDRPSALRTTYPLFAAHLAIREEFGAVPEAHEVITTYLGADAIGDESDYTSPDAYYNDCLVVRKALKEILSASPPPSDLRAELKKRLQNEEGLASLTHAEWTRCRGLIMGHRVPGVPRARRDIAYDSKTHTKKIKPPPVLSEKDLHEYPLVPDGGAGLWEGDPLDPDIPEFVPSTPKNMTMELSSGEPSDPDVPVLFCRRVADLRTPGDDRRISAMLPWIQTTRGVRSEADIHRLPVNLLIQAIYRLYHSRKWGEWACAWLMSTTGLSARRIRNLEFINEDNDAVADEGGCRYHRQTDVLEIHLSDGPSGPAGSAHRLVLLKIPTEIGSILSDSGQRYPLSQAPGYIDHALRRAFQEHPGLTPTANRIRSTGEAIIQGLAKDNSAALALRGEFGHASRGAAAYRQLEYRELNVLFSSVTSHLRSLAKPLGLDDSGAFPIHDVDPDAAHTEKGGFAGSSRALPPEHFQGVFTHLSDEFDKAASQTYREKGITGVTAETLLNLQQTHARLTYLALLFSTGIRPIVKRTQLRLIGECWHVQDKDSTDYEERRMIPALQSVVDQMIWHRQLTEELMTCAPSLKRMELSSTYKKDQDLPLWMEQTARGIRVRRMQQRDFDVVGINHGLEPRATRHTFVATLRNCISESELNAMLGHSGGGWFRESTISMTSTPYSDHAKKALSDFVRRGGFRAINPMGRYEY